MACFAILFHFISSSFHFYQASILTACRRLKGKRKGAVSSEWFSVRANIFDCEQMISQHFDFTSQYVCALSHAQKHTQGYVVEAEAAAY